MNEYLNMLSGYRDRVARITLFDIFHQLESKQLKDDKGRPIDYFGIGLLGILFFFENMLMRNRKTGIKALAEFLQETLREEVDLSEQGYYELAKQLIEIYRPASGKRKGRDFYNYETKAYERIDYAILKADHWDVDEQIQYYALDEQGLELVFATKEYFSEFQLSISQLMLRKQLEKGEFSSALRQIDEMRINVNTIRDKMSKIRHEIQKNIISDDTYKRYKGIIEDINRRLSQEHDEFKALSEFVKETRGHLNNQHSHKEKELNALEMIVRIDNELAHVHFLHANLLNESIELKTTAVEAAGESLYYAGVTAFNFEQEILGKLIHQPLPFESARVLAMPFMGVKHHQTWSLLSLFEPQVMERPNRHIYNEFLEVDHEEGLTDIKIRQGIYRLLLQNMMPLIGIEKEITLETLFERADNDVFGTRDFADMWLIMHQRSPLNIQEIVDREDHVFHLAFKEFLKDYDHVTVMELDDVVSYNGNYELKNMKLLLGGEKDHDRSDDNGIF